MQQSWTHLLVKLQLLCLGVAIAGVISSKLSLLPWRPALIIVGGAVVGLATVGFFSLLVVFAMFRRQQHNGIRHCLIAAGISLLPLGIVLYFGTQSAKVPPIHDISTDTDNPPQFSAVRSLRAPGDNSMEYGGKDVAELQHESFPEIKPMQLAMGPQEAFALCFAVVKQQGWSVIERNESEGRIEAMDESLFFGFKDDVVIFVTATTGGSRVDIRSASRVGVGDFGVNAKRITSFFTAFNEQAGSAVIR